MTVHRVFALALLCLAPLAAQGFKAGAAKVDITPPVGLHLMGFSDRTAPSTGVLDPLHARVLVLETAGERVAVVTLDVCRTFGPWWLDALRERAKASSGITHTLVVATHTHSAPMIDDAEDPASNGWERQTLEKVLSAISAAHKQAVDARLGIAYGTVDVGYNRRKVNAAGSVEMIWEDPERKPLGTVDPRVAVLRIDGSDGRPIAILVNHALHPVVFGVRGLSYSADFVGPLTAAVESSFGGAVCLFVQGACGDINPYHADVPPEQDPVAKRDWTAGVIAKETIRVANGITTQAPARPVLQAADDTLRFNGRWKKSAKDGYQLHVTAVLIGREIALIGMPGEPFLEFQTRLRTECPVGDCLFAGYANGYFGYFPTIRAAAEGGYGAADEETWIEPGAGERMLDHALVRIYEMLGRLKPEPER